MDEPGRVSERESERAREREQERAGGERERRTLNASSDRNEEARPKHDAASERQQRLRARATHDSQQTQSHQLRCCSTSSNPFHHHQFNSILKSDQIETFRGTTRISSWIEPEASRVEIDEPSGT